MELGSFSGNSHNATSLTLRALNSGDMFVYATMVFPAHRGRLRLLDSDPQLFGFCMEQSGIPAGALLAEQRTGGVVRVLSVFVSPEHRGRDICTMLLQAVEAASRKRSAAASLRLDSLSPRPTSAALEAALRRSGWDDPVRDLLLCEASGDFDKWPLYRGTRGEHEDFTLFPWHELTDEDRSWIETSQRESRWIPTDLHPLQFTMAELEPLNSLGIRHKGRPIGWVLTHRIAPDSIRYTTSFIHSDFQRGLHIFKAYRQAFQLQRAARIPKLSWIVPWKHQGMAAWVLRRWPKDLLKVSESRIYTKFLYESGSSVTQAESTTMREEAIVR